jgi:signal transduction histidine kinase/DNA-binding response OmpR family regulator
MYKTSRIIPIKITISILILNLILSIIYIYTSYDTQKKQILDIKKKVAKEILRDFQTSIDFSTLNNKKIMNKLLDSYVNKELGMFDVIVTDLTHRIICTSEEYITEKYWNSSYINNLLSSGKRLQIYRLNPSTMLLVTYIYNSGNTNEKIGIIEMKVSLEREHKEIREFLLKMILVGIGSIIILSFIAIWIARFVSAPILKLNEAANKIADGNLEVEINIKSKDEIGSLAHSFSIMAEKLKNMYALLENKVNERTKDLETANNKLENLNKQLLEANNAKSAFLASMSHELRTPLNAIIGFSELLRDGFLGEITDEQKETINDIYNSGKHLLTLINDILDLSKIEAGKVELNIEIVDIPELLVNSLTIIKERAMKHNITINSNINEKIGKVKADSVRIKQIVYNLLSNAVKFTPDGGMVTLSADVVEITDVLKDKDKYGFTDSLEKISRYNEFIAISVKDTGVGISKENINKLFKPFEQLHNTKLNNAEGTGLGLSLVKKLVELHNGTIIVESEEQKGSIFTVFIPFVSANLAEKGKEYNGDESTGITEYKYSALIIEDDINSAKLISKYLQDLNFHSDIAYNANDAFTALAKHKYDLITLDIFLPDKNGWDLLKELKTYNLLKGSDVIIISIEPDANKGIVMDVSDIMEKPINRKEFIDIVNRLKLKKMKNIKKILVVDDDRVVLDYCEKILSGEFEVECALNGKEALEKINLNKPDIVILDLLMPEIDGFELVHFIKKNETYGDIPLVILTNKDLTMDELKLLNNKIESIFAKSQFNKESFINEIKEILKKN